MCEEILRSLHPLPLACLLRTRWDRHRLCLVILSGFWEGLPSFLVLGIPGLRREGEGLLSLVLHPKVSEMSLPTLSLDSGLTL